MSEQALDLRRSARAVRRHKLLVGALAALGLLGGLGYTALEPPMLTSMALVVIPSANHASVPQGSSASGSSPPGVPDAANDISTQVVIAGSDPVLANALLSVDRRMSLQTLRMRVRVTDLTNSVISISAEGQNAAQAETTANAVARSFIAYVGSAQSPEGSVQARILGRVTTATGKPLSIRLLEFGGIGVLAGVLIGAVIAIAIGRGDRRLRGRDQIADSIGVPVLAAVAVGRPRDAAGWARLFEQYKPGAVDSWRLRMALHQLGLGGISAVEAAAGGASSLAVLSLSSDRKALALGPQLAAFAASLGIPVALVLGSQQDENVMAPLFAACAAGSTPTGQGGNLLLTVSDHRSASQVPGGAVLTIVVAVVDGQEPQVADTMRAATTVLGVSSGAATAEQLARVAASAAADGRGIAGILVADPDPADDTTGRVPQLTRPRHRGTPARITQTATEIRR